MTAQIKFSGKEQLNSFSEVFKQMFENGINLIDYRDYYNGIDLFKMLTNKKIQAAFSTRKSISIRITPNHSELIEKLYKFPANTAYLNKNLRFHFILEIIELVKNQNQINENLHLIPKQNVLFF